MTLDTLSKNVARRIIHDVGGSGTPPEYGFQYFTAGIEEYIETLGDEYLADYVKGGGSTFKMVVGTYGGGKTHFLYSVRELAWEHDFVVSYFALSPEQTPFHRLELVYRAIALNIVYPMSEEEFLSGYEHGIESLVRSWYAMKRNEFESEGLLGDDLVEELRNYASTIRGFESISFGRAMQAAFLAMLERRDDDFDTILQWVKCEAFERRIHSKFGILQRIDRNTAFSMIRSLIQWVRFLGRSGLVVLMDEAERVPSLSTRQRGLLLNNLRELIDECGHANFKNAFFLYAVPDESFLEGRAQIYEALSQRLATSFETINPAGVKILLENMDGDPIDTLVSIGEKLADIYETAYGTELHADHRGLAVREIALAAHEQRFGEIGYKRLFVQRLIRALHTLRRKGGPVRLQDVGFESA